MRITTTSELQQLLQWATGQGSPIAPLDTNPPVDNPTRYAGDMTWMDPPPYPPPYREMQQTHFYYVGMSERNELRTLVYLMDNGAQPDGSMPLPVGQIARWIVDAKAGGAGTPHKKFPGVDWHKPTFLVFLIDLPGWRFLIEQPDGPITRNKSMYFAEVLDTTGNPISCRNRSFYRARTVMVPSDASDPAHPKNYAVLVVENHHLKASNAVPPPYEWRREEHDADDYKYDIFLTLTIEHGNPDDVFPIILDPGGRNVGPP